MSDQVLRIAAFGSEAQARRDCGLRIAAPMPTQRRRLAWTVGLSDAGKAGYRAGFSLVEIMIVIVIIGLLAGVVTVNVRSYLIKAKQNTARQDMAVIVQGLDAFWTVYDRYPTNEEGLTVLTRPTGRMPEPPLSRRPMDPWGREYQYNSPGAGGPYELMCLGADGREGGQGADRDLTSSDVRDVQALGGP